MKTTKYLGVAAMLVVAALTITTNIFVAALAVIGAALTVFSWKEPSK